MFVEMNTVAMRLWQ